MDVVLVIPVRTRPQQHRRESAAHAECRTLSMQLARHRAIGERDRLAVGEHHRANASAIGAARLASWARPIPLRQAAGESKRGRNCEIVDDAATHSVQRRMSLRIQSAIAAPCAAEGNRRGLYRNRRLSGSTTGFQPPPDLAAAFAGPLDVGDAGAIAITSVSASGRRGGRRGRGCRRVIRLPGGRLSRGQGF